MKNKMILFSLLFFSILAYAQNGEPSNLFIDSKGIDQYSEFQPFKTYLKAYIFSQNNNVISTLDSGNADFILAIQGIEENRIGITLRKENDILYLGEYPLVLDIDKIESHIQQIYKDIEPFLLLKEPVIHWVDYYADSGLSVLYDEVQAQREAFRFTRYYVVQGGRFSNQIFCVPNRLIPDFEDDDAVPVPDPEIN